MRDAGGTERVLTFRVGDKVLPVDERALLYYGAYRGVTHGEIAGIQPGLVGALIVRWADGHGPFPGTVRVDPAAVRLLGEEAGGPAAAQAPGRDGRSRTARARCSSMPQPRGRRA